MRLLSALVLACSDTPSQQPADSTLAPWARALLEAGHSLGFVDTLSRLVGVRPQFARLPRLVVAPGQERAANLHHNERGYPIIGLSEHALTRFHERGVPTRASYRAVDTAQSFGDNTIGHEFGHLAASGIRNAPLADALLDIDPEAETSETFADDFQNAVQFLRSHSRDTSRLSPRSLRVMRVVLQFAPYANHPLNR